MERNTIFCKFFDNDKKDKKKEALLKSFFLRHLRILLRVP